MSWRACEIFNPPRLCSIAELSIQPGLNPNLIPPHVRSQAGTVGSVPGPTTALSEWFLLMALPWAFDSEGGEIRLGVRGI